MLKCIILDGDIATLNELVEYLEQVNRSLTEVNSCLLQISWAISLSSSVTEIGLYALIKKIFYIWKDTEIMSKYIGQKVNLYFRN